MEKMHRQVGCWCVCVEAGVPDIDLVTLRGNLQYVELTWVVGFLGHIQMG